MGTKAFVKVFDNEEGIPCVITGVKNPDNGLGKYIYTASTRSGDVLVLNRDEFSILKEDMALERSAGIPEEDPEQSAGMPEAEFEL